MLFGKWVLQPIFATMNPFLLLPLALVLAEIAAFIAIGGRIGIVATLVEVVLSGAIGMALVRAQASRIASDIAMASETGKAPVGPALDGAGLGLAALLLLIPGFVTDIIGLAIAIPPLRRRLVGRLLRRMRAWHTQQRGRASGQTIDGTFRHVDGDDVPTPQTTPVETLPKRSNGPSSDT